MEYLFQERMTLFTITVAEVQSHPQKVYSLLQKSLITWFKTELTNYWRKKLCNIGARRRSLLVQPSRAALRYYQRS